MTESELPVVDFHPYRWGDPAHAVTLPESVTAALALLGVSAPAAEPVDPAAARLPDTELPAAARDAFAAAIGAGHVVADPAARVAHTRGFSTPDLLALRAGDASDAPDAVLFPGGHDEVLAVLRICAEHRIAVVPFAGGTSVVGGLAPVRAGYAGVVTVDLRRLDALLDLDAESRVATLQAGVRTPRAETLLGENGFTLGHFPQSYEGASIGGYAATRSAGQSSAGYGRFDEMVVGLVVATPRGTVELGTAPKSAAGPDLRQLILGSEGAFGIITAVRLMIRPRPAERIFEGWRFADFAAGATAMRTLAQDGPRPTVLRLSDEAETAVNLADPSASSGIGGGPGGCLLIAGVEGEPGEVAARHAAINETLTELGGEALGTGPGESWRTGRFHGPYLRDPLLDAGALVETLETVTFWSNLGALKDAVTEAISAALTEQGTPPLVLCHISHVYAAGASLYFTVVCAASTDPITQWRTAKAAANEAIRAAGASITHHHAVGMDHRDTYAEEIGPLAVDVLRSVKQTLDPAGVLNPGILIR